MWRCEFDECSHIREGVPGYRRIGIFISILTLLSLLTRLEQRPLLFGSFGGVFAIASIVGPTIGGVLTDKCVT
jgi:MFS family permease